MRFWSRLVSLYRNLFRKDQLESELGDEVRAYLDLLTDQKIAQGLSWAEARRAAIMELGSEDQVKENVRDVRAGHSLEKIWQDVRFGVRVLLKRPAFTIVAVMTLALGIGANTAIFTLINAALLRALPFEDADQLVGRRPGKAGRDVATREAAGWSRNCSRSKSSPRGVAITISPSTTEPSGRPARNAACSSGKYLSSGRRSRLWMNTSFPPRNTIARNPSHFGS